MAFLFRWAFLLLFSLLWLAWKVIPVAGLVFLALAYWFQHDELLLLLRTLVGQVVGQEVDTGSDSVEYVPVVV